MGRKALRIAEAVDHPYSLIMAYCGLGLLVPPPRGPPPGDPGARTGLALSGRGHAGSVFPMIAAALGAAYALAGRVAEALPLLEQAVEQAHGDAHERSIRRYGRLAERGVSAGRPPGGGAARSRSVPWSSARTHKERGHEAYALRLLGDIAMRIASPRRSSRPKPTTARPSPWPRNSACARSRPTATAASARCMPDRPAGAGPRRAGHRHRPVPRHGHDLLAAPGRGSAGAGGEATMTFDAGADL